MTGRELALILRAIVRVMRDSSQIAEIHRVADITSRSRFRSLLDRAMVGGRPPAIMVKRPEIDDEHVDLDALRRLPADTLGGAYVRHLDRNDLALYVSPTSPEHVDDPEIRYLIHRYRQVHDIWHVLLGLGTRGHEEVLLHAFVLGHLRLPISALVVMFGTLKHMILEARWAALRHALLASYRSGRRASPLLMVTWEELWSRPLDDVRRQFGVRPCAPQHVG